MHGEGRKEGRKEAGEREEGTTRRRKSDDGDDDDEGRGVVGKPAARTKRPKERLVLSKPRYENTVTPLPRGIMNLSPAT